jgi:hypothetical protein
MKGQVILRNLQWSGRHNPGFPPGSTQTAVAELLNPTSSILPYSGRLCLDKPAVVCTGTKYFNINAGATKDVNFPILMPTEEGTYGVYLSIFHNDELLEEYQAPEDVVIGVAQYTLEVTVEPPGAGYVTKSPSKATYPTGEVVTLTAHPHSGYEFDHWGGWPPYPGIQSTSPTLNLTMTSDWWVVAAFRKVEVAGFSLSLMDILPTLVLWNANFGYKTFDYDPIADSGWLAWNESWIYPSDPLGCTSLRVWALDAQDNILFDVWNKGPIYANRKYAFNCQTLKLWDVTEYPGVIIG